MDPYLALYGSPKKIKEALDQREGSHKITSHFDYWK
jgi:hypothetical protein